MDNPHCTNLEIFSPTVGKGSILHSKMEDIILPNTRSKDYLMTENALFETKPFLETVFQENVQLESSDLLFYSNFESGNLRRADRLHFQRYQEGSPIHYALWLKNDPFQSQSDNKVSEGLAQWFFFRIGNLAQNQEYRIHIVNMSKRNSVLERGMRPLCANANDPNILNLKWHRKGEYTAYRSTKELGIFRKNEASSNYCFSFSIFSSKCESSIYIALTQPYTSAHLQATINANESPHIKYTSLCQTPENRDVVLIKVTENLNEREVDTLNERGLKPVLFFCARAVASSTPDSFLMDGILQWLASTDPNASKIRRDFVIFLIPMLNPDGVYHGNTRTDAQGYDLSRCWFRPCKRLHPAIYQLKRLLCRWLKQERLASSIELSSHSRKIGSFFYGVQQEEPEFGAHKDRKVVLTSRRRDNKLAPVNNQTCDIIPKTKPRFFRPTQWEFLLAFMYRFPLLFDHRACAFEPLHAHHPHTIGTETETNKAVPQDAMNGSPVCNVDMTLRQLVHTHKSYPPLVFTYYISIFKGLKSHLCTRHLNAVDYQTTGIGLLHSIAQSLQFRDSETLNGFDTAHNLEVYRDFVVTNNAILTGDGKLRGRHSSQVIVRALQLPGDHSIRIDDDHCSDLDAWECEHMLSSRAVVSFASVETCGAWHESPLVSDESSSDSESSEEVISPTEPAFTRCETCGLNHASCKCACQPCPPKKKKKRKKDEEYYVTDAFYRRIVQRYLRPSAPQYEGSSGVAMTRKHSQRKGAGGCKKASSAPSFYDRLLNDERLWLASHHPLAQYTGNMRSRKLTEQIDNVATQYERFALQVSSIEAKSIFVSNASKSKVSATRTDEHDVELDALTIVPQPPKGFKASSTSSSAVSRRDRAFSALHTPSLRQALEDSLINEYVPGCVVRQFAEIYPQNL